MFWIGGVEREARLHWAKIDSWLFNVLVLQTGPNLQSKETRNRTGRANFKNFTRFYFSKTKPADGTLGSLLVMQSTASHLRCLHVLYHQQEMSSVIGPTQTAALGEPMPLNSQWEQQRPVSTFPAGLSLTVGEKGFCPGVNTYVLQLRKQGGPLRTGSSSTQHALCCIFTGENGGKQTVRRVKWNPD